MKLFFFSNKSYGENYTIMAENEGSARNLLLDKMERNRDAQVKAIQDMYCRQKDPNVAKLKIQDAIEGWEKKMDLDGRYDMEVYGAGEIVTTFNE